MKFMSIAKNENARLAIIFAILAALSIVVAFAVQPGASATHYGDKPVELLDK